jgi:hypothetical protein
MEPADRLTKQLQAFLDTHAAYVLVVRNPAQADKVVQTRWEMVQLVSELRGIRLSADIQNKIDNLTDGDFYDFVRISFAMKAWHRDKLVPTEKAYELFAALLQGKKQFLELYFSMRQSSSAEQIFASIITFLNRVQLYEEQRESLSDFYRVLVKRARAQFSQMRKALAWLIQCSEVIDSEVRYLAFYFQLVSA